MRIANPLAIGTLALGAALVHAQSLPQQFAPANVLRVMGAAQVRVAPDIFTVSLGVDTNAPLVPKAVATNDRHVKDLFKVFEAAGLAESEVRTTNFSISPDYDYESDELTGYDVSKTFVVSVSDVVTLQDLISKALQHGANRVGSISFNSTQIKQHRDRARQLALELAKEKATKLAAQAGRTLGPVLSITETGGGSYSPGSTRSDPRYQGVIADLPPGGLPDEATVSTGSLSITAVLVVDFVLK